MVNTDVIVIAQPVYFYTMDGQIKTLIDRTLPRYEEIQEELRIFYFIVAAADYTGYPWWNLPLKDSAVLHRIACQGAHEKESFMGQGPQRARDIRTVLRWKQVYDIRKTDLGGIFYNLGKGIYDRQDNLEAWSISYIRQWAYPCQARGSG